MLGCCSKTTFWGWTFFFGHLLIWREEWWRWTGELLALWKKLMDFRQNLLRWQLFLHKLMKFRHCQDVSHAMQVFAAELVWICWQHLNVMLNLSSLSVKHLPSSLKRQPFCLRKLRWWADSQCSLDSFHIGRFLSCQHFVCWQQTLSNVKQKTRSKTHNWWLGLMFPPFSVWGVLGV